MTDIVEVLTPPNSFSDTATAIVSAGEMRDAVAEITSLRAENERLRAALENPVSDDEHIWIYERAAAMFRDWSRAGVRGQKIYPQDGIEYWTALAMRECLIARAALAAQPAPSPWRPIETAPKTQDESRFGPLIVLTSTHGHRAIGYWGERGGRWGWVNPNDHQIMDYWNAFTHWMPLPPAPKEVE